VNSRPGLWFDLHPSAVLRGPSDQIGYKALQWATTLIQHSRRRTRVLPVKEPTSQV